MGMEGIDSALLTQTYYHGLVNKKEVEESLTQDGDFLVCILEEDILSNKKVKLYCILSKLLLFRVL